MFNMLTGSFDVVAEAVDRATARSEQSCQHGGQKEKYNIFS